MTNEQESSPWYKEFWGVFVFAPLVIVVIACAITVTIAFKHSDDVVIDNYYKEGRMINQRFEQDQQAVALGLSGELTFDMELGEVHLSLHANEALPEKLLLVLSHPASADNDRELTLHFMAPGRYRADLETSLSHRWYVRLVPASTMAESNQADWRLKGEIDFAKGSSLNFGEL